MSKTTSSCQTYDSPEVTVVGIGPQQVLAASDTLNDMDNNPLYKENF